MPFQFPSLFHNDILLISKAQLTYKKMPLVFSPFLPPSIPLALGVKCWGIIFHSIFWLVVVPC